MADVDAEEIPRCRMSNKTVCWIPREAWIHGERVECLTGCHQQVRFRVRGFDLPGSARILPHRTDGKPCR